jgi:hypothetical protein
MTVMAMTAVSLSLFSSVPIFWLSNLPSEQTGLPAQVLQDPETIAALSNA